MIKAFIFHCVKPMIIKKNYVIIPSQVQNLIERCLQLYMNQKEVVETLLEQAKIEPGFTELGNPYSSLKSCVNRFYSTSLKTGFLFC